MDLATMYLSGVSVDDIQWVSGATPRTIARAVRERLSRFVVPPVNTERLCDIYSKGKHSIADLAVQFKIPEHAVVQILPDPDLSGLTLETMAEMYHAHWPVRRIADYYGIASFEVEVLLEEAGVEEITDRKYSFNDTHFSKLDTDSARDLGVFMALGDVSTRLTDVSMPLGTIEHLFDGPAPVVDNKVWVNSDRLAEDLFVWGCYPHTAWREVRVPAKWEKPFIAGYLSTCRVMPGNAEIIGPQKVLRFITDRIGAAAPMPYNGQWRAVMKEKDFNKVKEEYEF